MTPKHATLQGSLGILAGLGRDRISIDLSTIPEDALTVAIRGDNGTGKSTLLSLALVPWREPPVAGSIYDQFGPTGLRELIWTHAGQEYWSRIEYKTSGKTKTQKATMKVRQDGQWVPVTLPDHTVSDGKSSTYDACLAHILGPQTLFYLAAFRGQGAPKLAEYSDPKGLMRDLLALDEVAALTEQAKDVTRDMKRHHEAAREQAKALDRHAERIADLEAASREISERLPGLSDSRRAAVEATAVAKAELERAMTGDLDRQRLLERRAECQRRTLEIKDSGIARVRAAEQALDAARARSDRVAVQVQTSAQAILKDLRRAQDRATAAEAALACRDAIQAAEAEVQRLTAAMDEREGAVESIRAQMDLARDKLSQLRRLQDRLDLIAGDGGALKARCDELIVRAGFADLVPCQGEGEYAACPALAEVLAARDQLQAAEAERNARRADWRATSAQIAALGDAKAELDGLCARQAEARRDANAIKVQLEQARQGAAQAATLAMAERNLEDARTAIADLTARQQADADAGRQALADADADVADCQTALDAAKTEARAALDAALADLAAVPLPDTNAALDQARQHLDEAEATAHAAQVALEQAVAAQAQHQAEIERLRGELDRGQTLLDQVRHLEEEIADWILLAKGLQGVIDLSIEDAGPGIAALANKLLAEAYGPRFSVRIVTQRTQVNGVAKECFDISVIDADSGLESSILQKSGGEGVWLDKALTDAVALYHQESAGQHYECLFADEVDGALSAEKRMAFIRMDRAALVMGGYARKFFISHSPDAWALADHVIDLSQYRTKGDFS